MDKVAKVIEKNKITPIAEPQVMDLGDVVVFEYFKNDDTVDRITFKKGKNGGIVSAGVKVEKSTPEKEVFTLKDSPFYEQKVKELRDKKSQEVEVQEEIKVEDTPQEDIIEAEVEVKPVADKEPRTPSEPEKGRVRLTKVDKDLDALIEEGVKAEGGLRVKLSEKGYRPDQIDRAIRRKDSDALAELRNLKADLERQGQANKKYTVKSTKEFKKQLNDIINKIAGDRNIKFTRGELKGILNSAIGKDMQGLKVEKAIENAIVQVEKATKRKITENIGELIKMSNVEGKQGKRMVGKISPEARLFFDQLRKQVKEADLKKMTLSELESIEEELSTPSDDITQATSAAYTNGEITKENGVKVTNEVQDVLATNSKIKGIQNTTQRS